ncbi:peptidase A24 [Methanofollis formosanus]|uniref:Peptidase A24 n=1 Tax=Methanofollis formosanus TaxID=299308 RepID=A0A8G1EGB2_9EURY|nr:A24 family peptidase C-terminal domain-containing protein [Methanofollis formosanus]QYZ78737.1 peptidase A24 [Methanofollis formosanus]
MILSLLIASAAVGITLLYASVLDHRDRRVPFRTWYPMLAVAFPAVLVFYAGLLLGGEMKMAVYFVALSLVFSAVFYAFGSLHLFGGADAWALIFLSVCIPAFPLEPIVGIPPLEFFPFSVLTNALILNLAAPLILFARNVANRDLAPFPYMFLGYPVDGEQIRDHYGFVMEEIEESADGTLTRRFLRIRDSLRRTVKGGERRMYTKDLREHPEKYRKELALYKQAGPVWISYAVPFIIPITAGFLTALFIGDLFYMIMRILIGA